MLRERHAERHFAPRVDREARAVHGARERARSTSAVVDVRRPVDADLDEVDGAQDPAFSPDEQAVRAHRDAHAVRFGALDERFDPLVHERLAAVEAHRQSAELRELVDHAERGAGLHLWGTRVDLVAIGAVEVASVRRFDVHHERSMPLRDAARDDAGCELAGIGDVVLRSEARRRARRVARVGDGVSEGLGRRYRRGDFRGSDEGQVMHVSSDDGGRREHRERSRNSRERAGRARR